MGYGRLAWARTVAQMSQCLRSLVLINLAERRRDATMAETALSQINVAFETMRDGGNAPNAAYYEKQLPKARALVARLRRQ